MRASFISPVLRDASGIDYGELETIFARLENEGRRALREQGVADKAMSFAREYDARYRGQSFELDIEHGGSVAAIVDRFHEKHERRYGYAVRDEAVELVNARLTAIGDLPHVKEPGDGSPPDDSHAPDGTRDVYIDGAFHAVPVYDRKRLPPRVDGPALVEQYDTCTYVPPGWSARAGNVMAVERTL
jgi:N-methylhydantoinase A